MARAKKSEKIVTEAPVQAPVQEATVEKTASKSDLVRDLIINGTDKPRDIMTALQAQGIAVSTGLIQSVKKKLAGGDNGNGKARKVRSTVSVVKPEGLSREEIVALAGLVRKAGANQVRMVLDVCECLG